MERPPGPFPQLRHPAQDIHTVGLEAVLKRAVRQLTGDDRRHAGVHILPERVVAGVALRVRRVDGVPLARGTRREMCLQFKISPGLISVLR